MFPLKLVIGKYTVSMQQCI